MFKNKYNIQHHPDEYSANILLNDAKKNMNNLRNNNLRNNILINQPTTTPIINKNRFKLIQSIPVPINKQFGLYSDEVLEQEYAKKSYRQYNSTIMTNNIRNKQHNLDDYMNINSSIPNYEPLTKYDLFENKPYINVEDDDEVDDDKSPIHLKQTVPNKLIDTTIKIEVESPPIIDSNFDYRNYINESREIKYEGYVVSNESSNTEIPRVCYTTWHSDKLPPKMKSNYDILCKNNPEIRFELFDENKCRKFIEDNYDKDVLDAYDKLVPASYKSDLWRYCILFRMGGIYIDIKYITTNGFRLIELCGKEHFVLDRDKYWENNQLGLYTALISTKPRNKILRTCIQTITQNAETYTYGYNALYPTGPGLLGNIYFNNDLYNNIYRIKDIELYHSESNDIIYKNTVVLKIYNEYRDEQKIFQNNLHYTNLWEKRAIYNMNFKFIVEKTNVNINTYLPSVCCIIHIGNYSIFQKMRHFIDNLVSAQYDAYNLNIYFNVVEGAVSSEEMNSLKKSYPNEYIIVSENYGFDIGSFFHTLQYIKQKQLKFDFILKIHTKTNANLRTNLLEPILGSIQNIRNVFSVFDSNKNTGIIAARKGRCIDAHIDFTRNQPYLQELVKCYFNETTAVCKQPYVSGTMFWMRFSMIDELFMNYDLPNIYNSMNNIYSFDWNWYYYANTKYIGTIPLNKSKLYEHYLKHGKTLQISGNIFHAIKYNTNSSLLRDGMIEHAYERFFCYGMHRLGYQLHFIT